MGDKETEPHEKDAETDKSKPDILPPPQIHHIPSTHFMEECLNSSIKIPTKETTEVQLHRNTLYNMHILQNSIQDN